LSDAVKQAEPRGRQKKVFDPLKEAPKLIFTPVNPLFSIPVPPSEGSIAPKVMSGGMLPIAPIGEL
jgi:hypothetical protein